MTTRTDDMPVRLYVSEHHSSGMYCGKVKQYAETHAFIRADIAQQLAAALETAIWRLKEVERNTYHSAESSDLEPALAAYKATVEA